MLLRKDFHLAKVVWEMTRYWTTNVSWPRMDPTCQYVAWTQSPTPFAGGHGNVSVALKHLRDPMYQPPAGIMINTGTYFCDWTEDGDLLVNYVDGDQWRLGVVDLSGKLLKTLATDSPPAPGIVASWRKYTHQ